jgi:uncharacterized protein (DUF2141 family)
MRMNFAHRNRVTVKLGLFLLMMVCSLLSQAQYRVEIVVTGVRDTTGVIMVALFAGSETFLKKPVVGKFARAENGRAVVVFEGQPAGEYAASVIHDANRNRKLDTNFLGMPREGFGFSNDAMGTFGPPSFEKARFNVTEPISIHIKTRYL